MLVFLIFLFGLCIGSFLNVLIDRFPTNESPFVGRSRCDYCKKNLSVIDLVPLFSYIFLGGKCRFCKKKLSYYYPVTEFSTGFLFVVTLLSVQSASFGISMYSPDFYIRIILHLLIVSTLIVIFFTDLKSGIIPFSAVLTGTIIVLLLRLLTDDTTIFNYLLSATGALVGFLILFYFANLIAKGEGMGFGDVVYVFLMGFLLGFPQILLGLYIAFVSGGLFSLALVILKKKKFRGGTIPFGPFLVIGTLSCLFWGNALVDFSLSYLHR
jgi:leader peptidase (prepilin peptidase)/N-methyltransferase